MSVICMKRDIKERHVTISSFFAKEKMVFKSKLLRNPIKVFLRGINGKKGCCKGEKETHFLSVA